MSPIGPTDGARGAQGFAPRGTKSEVEDGLAFSPRFAADGTIPVVATDVTSGDVVMLGYMNAESLASTIETGIAHYWSRSRARLWIKGETSGNRHRVLEMRTDCDQDAIWIRVAVEGHGATCHTGHHSCFYRRVPVETPVSPELALESAGDERVFDPDEVYSDRS